MNLKKDTIIVFAAILAAICIFFYFILGIVGAVSAVGIVIFFIFPIYSILNNLELDSDEKIALSFFIGIGVFPIIVYWLGTFISFRLSILIAWVLLVLASLLIRKYKKNE